MKKVFLLLILLSCTIIPSVKFDKVSFNVELARTVEEQEKGLMFRDSMPDNHGMIFLFNAEMERSFWMKNTLIPLDMVFLDKNMTVKEVKANVQPCKADPCEVYNSKPAMYVLEINAGLADKYQIKEGAKMILRQ